MTDSAWTSDDRQPGDVDDMLRSIDPQLTETLRGSADVTVRAVLELDVEDLPRLNRISARRGQDPPEIISELIRDAERSAAGQ